MSQITEIGRYMLMIHSHIIYSEIIMLYPKEGTGILARYYFHRNDTNTHVSMSGQITNVVLPKDQYLATVDILRNEKPVFFHSAETYAKISTSSEDVGEGEI